MASIHPQTHIGSVHIKVSDINRSIAFYTDIIGFKLLERKENIASLTVDGHKPLVVVEGGAKPKSGRTTGLYHFAILVPTRKALANSLLQLIKKQYPLQGASDHFTHEALYLADPDQNGIEIAWDRPREVWTKDTGEVIMTTDALDLQTLLSEASAEMAYEMPNGTTIGHVHLHVSDLLAADGFYHGVLGFDKIAYYGSQALFVSAGGYHHHIALNTWAGVGAPKPPDDAVGLKYYTVVVPNEAVLNQLVTDVKRAGYTIESRDNDYFVLDPSGNGILLCKE